MFIALDSTHSPLLANLQRIRMPKHSASAVLEYKAPQIFQHGDQFTSALFYKFIGDREDLETRPPYGEHKHSNYQLFNLTLSYKLGDVVAPDLREAERLVRIQNLFDRNYSQAFGLPAPPINFEVGAKMGL